MTPHSPRVAVVGSGILGLTTALTLAGKGFHVSLFERDSVLFDRTSKTGEGKIHLGLIYPLGDGETREFLLRGALMFSDYFESISSVPINWQSLKSAPFTNIVMPDSLMSPDEVEHAYNLHQLEFENLASSLGTRYLGEDIQQLFTPGIEVHPLTGLPSLRTHERAICPSALRKILLMELEKSNNITTFLNHMVRAMTNNSHSVSVEVQNASETRTVHFDAVVNCAWENQAQFIPTSQLPVQNLRYKTGIHIPRSDLDITRCDTATMVNGPFGDIVIHPNHVYLSWYPHARLNYEQTGTPIKNMTHAVEHALRDNKLIHQHIHTFQELGFLGDVTSLDLSRVTVSGGYILGEGSFDIDDPLSGLHSRPNRGVIQDKGIFSPLNYKFTTAPLMASEAAKTISAYLQVDSERA